VGLLIDVLYKKLRPRSEVGYASVRIHCRRGKAENVNRFHLLDTQFLGSCLTGSSSPTVRALPIPSPLPARDEPPLELLDEILSYFPSDDKQGKRSLRNCSLVAKSWVNPSQSRLFKTVEIRERNLWSWLISISPENEGLSQHVRSLRHTRVRQRDSLVEPEYTIRALGGYLQSFRRLRHLSLSSIRIPSAISYKIKIFSAFQNTLSRLSLLYHD